MKDRSYPASASGSARLARLAGAALVLVAATSLALNVYLGRAALRYYDAASALRLDPGGLKTYAPDRAKPSAAGPLLVFFGDSRALMWARPAAPTGYRIVNRGIGFQTTEQVLLRLEPDVLALHPDVVVLEAGVNDLKTIAEFPEKKAEIVADCKANLERIVRGCVGSGATVVLVTVFDIGDVPLWRRPFWSNDVEAAVREVNAFLPALVGAKVVLFDANPVIEGPGGEIQSPYQIDHLHLTSAGYAALNQRLVPVISGLRM